MKHIGCGLVIVLAILFMCIAPAIELWLWNWVLVDLFNAPVVNFWQMCGIHWLCTLLFRSVISINRE